ncbi:hypothetical protein [Streptomyces sp. NPDC007110]|uniref:hypothetical protein n=1 Tax=Streptomyces sp. NPDC007110 TaxID=3156916 RepID=UPI0033E32FCD
MIPLRRYMYAAAAGAVLLATACARAIFLHAYMPAALFAFGALILTEAALREHRRSKRRRLEADWARRRALGEMPPPLAPCCLLATHSHGEAHSENCTSDHSLTAFLDHIEQQHRESQLTAKPAQDHKHEPAARQANPTTKDHT